MNFSQLARDYLKELNQFYLSANESSEATPELSFRPALHNFFRALVNGIEADSSTSIDIIFEPKTQRRAGRPDWRFYHSKNLGVFGFVEAKSLDTRTAINPQKFESQIGKYLQLEQNLVLTDGIDFVFYLKSDCWNPKTVSLARKPLPETSWEDCQIDPRLEVAFREFFQVPEPRECSEAQLVSEIAHRAARLAEDVAALVELDPASAHDERERVAITKLRKLKEFLQQSHDPALAEDKPFADFVAQVLCFGLLYSHRSGLTTAATPQVQYEKIHQYWIDGLAGAVAPLRPFQELILQLKDDLEPKAGDESVLSTWYDDCRHLLAYTRLRDDQREAPDYHMLYESFLQKFDPDTRFDFGAFYTPKELAAFVVKLTDHVARKVYKESIFEPGNKLIDPCCGTGTFIEQILKQVPKDAGPEIVGFEILPAPYALAHYRLDQIGKTEDARNNVRILLTNTISDLLSERGIPENHTPNLFEEEQIEARECASPPIIAVIGNPPSSDSTKAPHQLAKIYSHITELLEDFRPPPDRRTTRQNTQKQLRNDFVRFVRWAADRVSNGPKGMIALIVPESFLEHGTYRYARKWLAENFQFAWVLDIDADQRASGGNTGIFNALQGRALLIAARNDSLPYSPTLIRYGSIRELAVADKKKWLSSPLADKAIGDLFPEKIEMDTLHTFRPRGKYDKDMWLRSWPIYSSAPASDLPSGQHAIFVRHSSALKLGATSLIVHPDGAMLQRRTKELTDPRKTFAQLKDAWFTGQSKPPSEQKLLPLRPALQAAANARPSSYLLRPFVNLSAVLDERVLDALTSMPGGGARPRPEVRRALSMTDNLAFTIAPSRKDIADDLHRFVSFCWGIPDNDLCRRGNAQVVARLFPDYKPLRGDWNSTPRENFDEQLLSQLPSLNGIDKGESILYYSYAMLCSEAYLEAFAGALFTTASADSIPRIPITGDADSYEKIASFGKQLAHLENPAASIVLSATRTTLLNSFEQKDSSKLHSCRQIVQEDGRVMLELVDSSGSALFTTDPIVSNIANFKVSGYAVIDEWVKWHSHRYARTPLRTSTVTAFLQLITRLESQSAIQIDLDAVIEDVLASPETWIAFPV